MNTMTATISDSPLAALLGDLSDVQRELLAVIGEKRTLLMTADTAGLARLQPREAELIGRLQECQERRAAMLSQASADGPETKSLRQLAAALPGNKRRQIEPQVQAAAAQARLLQHHSLTNWVVVQRTLIHLSQMLEIIATGGRLRPTYGTGVTTDTAGNLVDQEA